ncbi:MAG: rhomboid family intramembrane serine protease [Dysgonamonadaceae bacterium]|jgi:membrane associated rhomboid family serine protease|nr:rhomboid family intramembrane serine protease [Dysgonamonadaceae bacterium]
MKIEAKKIVYSLTFPALFVLTIGLIWLLEKGMEADWYQWGVFPRSINGLRGILTQPLIHSDIRHLFSNSVPLLVLGWCLFYFYKELSFAVFPCLWILSGSFTWLLGRDSWHIGASGLIYALSFFLFFSGIFRKYIPLLSVSLLVAFLYGSAVWNMFPVAELVDPSISWEGHLSGGISGLICAALFKNYGPQKPEEEEEEEEETEQDEL